MNYTPTRFNGDNYWALCNGCGAHMYEPQIAYTNEDGDDYCKDCTLAILDDPESRGDLNPDDFIHLKNNKQ